MIGEEEIKRRLLKMPDIIKRIRKHMWLAGLNQRQLSKICGISEKTISNLMCKNIKSFKIAEELLGMFDKGQIQERMK